MAEIGKNLREKLMHSDGTTPLETISVIVPTLFYTSITTILVSSLEIQKSNGAFRFCIEFTTLVMPVVLNFTILAEYTLQILFTLFVMCSSLILLKLDWKMRGKQPPEPPGQVQDFITNSRSTINILSVIAILAVDFLIFPRKFAKTETFGYSLMDVGVGLFIYSNGIVEGGKTSLSKSLKGCLPLLVLGTARFLAVRLLGYHVPVSEYGVHWNFFLTLALTKFFVSLILRVIDVRFIWINASLLMISHEILLEMGLKNFVLSNTKRGNFIDANKEGLVSSMGYVCMYLFSAFFSHFLNWKREKSRKKVVLRFTILSILTLSVSLICQRYFGISRKLANSAYCFWVLFIGVFMTGLYCIVGEILRRVFESVRSPLIFQAINYNGLAFFLISNLLTGLVNISCDTLRVGTVISVVIISIYMFINCAIVCILYKKRIKLKL